MDLSYPKLLSELVDFTDTKLVVIAQDLGYDTSYISKWCSGSKLPAEKNIHVINRRLARLFAETIVDEGQIRAFSTHFKSQIIEAGSRKDNIMTLEARIYSLLNDAYKTARPDSPLASNVNETYFYIGRHTIHQVLHQELKRVLNPKEDEQLDIWTSFDILSETARFILEELQNSMTPKKRRRRVKVHLGYNKETHFPDQETLQDVFEVLNRYSHINIECFDSSNFPNLNFIIIKDKFFVDLSLDDEGNFLTMTCGFDIQTIDNYFNFVRPYFCQEYSFISLTTSDEMAQSNYRTNFYSGKKFFFLCNYGFEFLLPPDIVEDIAEYAPCSGGFKHERLEILRLQVTWEELFEKSESHFFVPKRAFLDYLETGELLYCSTHYVLDVLERQRHVDQIIKTMEKNPNIHFYMIEDELFKPARGFFSRQFNLFANESLLYMKNINMAPEGESSMVSIFQDHDLFKSASLWLEATVDFPSCREYSAEELRDFYKRYSKMLWRLEKVSKSNK